MSRGDESFVRWHVQRDFWLGYWRGARWWFYNFVPPLRRLQRSAKSVRAKALVSDAWFRFGYVHWVQGAEREAIRCFRRSIRWFPRPDHSTEPWYCMGVSHQHLGEYGKAIRCFTKGLKLNPDDEMLLCELDSARSDLAEDRPPLTEEDEYQRLTELLAQNRPKNVLESLHRKRSLRARYFRTYAYGLLEDRESHLAEWRKISRGTHEIYLSWDDYFYLPDKTWDDPEFWRILQRVEEDDRIDPSSLPGDASETLKQHIPPPETYEGVEYRAWKHRYYTAILRYQVARSSDDLRDLRAISRTYPKWTEAKESLKLLTRRHRKSSR